MRIRRFAVVAALLIGSASAAACTGPTADPVETSDLESSESPTAPAVYVSQITTLEGDGELYDAQEPDSLMLQEFTDASELEWETWGGETAVATGLVSGMWCAPDCTEEGYPATIVLCDVVDDHYQRFGVFGEFPGEPPEAWILNYVLTFNTLPEIEEDPVGCDEPDPAPNA